MTTAIAAPDLDTPYALTPAQITRFREDGFIKLKDVLSPEAIAHYGEAVTRKTMALNPNRDTPIDARDLAISDESERLIREAIREQGVIEVYEPYDLGEVMADALNPVLYEAG